jgi:hypothetical protein
LTIRKFVGATGAVNAAWLNLTETPATVTVALRVAVPVFAPTE